MKTIIASLAILMSSAWMVSPVEAQIRVGRFGGVSIRMPLVSVDVLPFGGGTAVRAPFTRINTGWYGGYNGLAYGGLAYGRDSSHFGAHHDSGDGHYVGGYDGQHFGYPIHPSDQHASPHTIYQDAPYDFGYHRPAFDHHGPGIPIDGLRITPTVPRPVLPQRNSQMDRSTLVDPIPRAEVARPFTERLHAFDSIYATPDALLQSARTLKRSLLARGNDAEVWLDYLQPDQVIDTIHTRGDANPLAILLRNYDGLADNAKLSDIASLPGFRRTHQGLRVWVNRHANPGRPRQSIPDRGRSNEDASSSRQLPAADSVPAQPLIQPSLAPLPAPAQKADAIPQPVPDPTSNTEPATSKPSGEEI